jgi:superfamily II DNA or RNA helicase
VWNSPHDPRRWQSEALAKWIDRDRKGIAHVVTGAGKTRFAEMCIANFFSGNPEGRVVIIVPTLALLDQWYVDLREELGADGDEIALYSGEEKASDRRPLSLLVLNTARSVAPGLAGEASSLLIVDECHRAASPVNARALQGDYKAALGLSATPMREYDSGFEDYLVPTLGHIFYSYDYDDARRDEVITEFSLVNVAVPLTAEEEAKYSALSGRVARAAKEVDAGRGDHDKLRRLLRDRAAVSGGARMRVPACVSLAEQYRGERMVIFHERIAAAEEIVDLLKQRGHNVTIYHSRISDALRRDNLRLFRKGVFQVLVSCRALDEGMNVPEAEVGIIASSTASARQRIQRLGRVLRPAPNKDRATVVTLYATEVEKRRLETEAATLEAAYDVTWRVVEMPNA